MIKNGTLEHYAQTLEKIRYEVAQELKEVDSDTDIFNILSKVQNLCDETLKYKGVCPLKIKSVFYAKDRLDELDEIPEMPNGGVDYWKASQLLCEKDGGRLPTMEELAQLANYIYGVNIPPYADVDRLKVKQMCEELQKFEMPFYVWSSEEYDSDGAYRRNFGSGDTDYNYYGRRHNTFLLAVCLGE